ncbi:Hypothetical predicted protein, partial [Paramuricea clavata]
MADGLKFDAVVWKAEGLKFDAAVWTKLIQYNEKRLKWSETQQSKLSNADQPNSCTENLNNGLRINATASQVSDDNYITVMDSSFDVSTTLLDAKIVNQKPSNVSPSLAESCLESESQQSNADQTNSCTENLNNNGLILNATASQVSDDNHIMDSSLDVSTTLPDDKIVNQEASNVSSSQAKIDCQCSCGVIAAELEAIKFDISLLQNEMQTSSNPGSEYSHLYELNRLKSELLQEKEKSSALEKEMALLVRERNREFDELRELINTLERNLNKCEQEKDSITLALNLIMQDKISVSNNENITKSNEQQWVPSKTCNHLPSIQNQIPQHGLQSVIHRNRYSPLFIEDNTNADIPDIQDERQESINLSYKDRVQHGKSRTTTKRTESTRQS